MSDGNTYGVEDLDRGGKHYGVKSVSRAQFERTDPIGQGMMSTAERKMTLWHSANLGANRGSRESRTTGFGMAGNRSEGSN